MAHQCRRRLAQLAKSAAALRGYHLRQRRHGEEWPWRRGGNLKKS
jgi:hypothetical protein